MFNLKQYLKNKERANIFNQYHNKGDIVELIDPVNNARFVRITEQARASAYRVMIGINREPYFININQLKIAGF